MSWFMVDVEANGPIPGDYSMTEIGVIRMDKDLEHAPWFHGKFQPLPGANWDPNAYLVVKYDHAHAMTFRDPLGEMEQLDRFIKENNRGNNPMLVSDNNGFDAMFVAWYFHHFLGRNPFGHSSMNLGSLYKGLVRTTRENFKHLRVTRHTHNPVDDARGNAEALLTMVNEMKLKMGGIE
jgi:hypothetical protein